MKVEINAPNLDFCSLLFIVFLVLKLTHVIDWNWWWVTCPIWIPVGLYLVILAIVLLIYFFGAVITIFSKRW